MSTLANLSAAELADAVAHRRTSAARAVEACFARADEVGAGADGLNIVLYQDRAASRVEADGLDRLLEGAADASEASASGAHAEGAPGRALAGRHSLLSRRGPLS